jgi:hypothetical protein
MTVHKVDAELKGLVGEIAELVGSTPYGEARCLRCAAKFEPEQYVVTFEAWTVDRDEKLEPVDLHFHAKCAEELVSALIQDVARLVDNQDVGLYTALRHKEISTALSALLVAGAPKVLVHKAKRRLTK